MSARTTHESRSRRRTTRASSRTLSAPMRQRYEIVLAMADALEDILRWERRRVA